MHAPCLTILAAMVFSRVGGRPDAAEGRMGEAGRLARWQAGGIGEKGGRRLDERALKQAAGGRRRAAWLSGWRAKRRLQRSGTCTRRVHPYTE